MDDHTRELKKQKSNDEVQSKRRFLSDLLSEYLEMKNTNVILNINTGQTTMASAWKCEFCHSSQVAEVGLAELKEALIFVQY